MVKKERMCFASGSLKRMYFLSSSKECEFPRATSVLLSTQKLEWGVGDCGKQMNRGVAVGCRKWFHNSRPIIIYFPLFKEKLNRFRSQSSNHALSN